MASGNKFIEEGVLLNRHGTKELSELIEKGVPLNRQQKRARKKIDKRKAKKLGLTLGEYYECYEIGGGPREPRLESIASSARQNESPS